MRAAVLATSMDPYSVAVNLRVSFSTFTVYLGIRSWTHTHASPQTYVCIYQYMVIIDMQNKESKHGTVGGTGKKGAAEAKKSINKYVEHQLRMRHRIRKCTNHTNSLGGCLYMARMQVQWFPPWQLSMPYDKHRAATSGML